MDRRPLLPSTNPSGAIYRVYKKRWFMLVVLTLLSISNGMVWFSFAPVADKSGEYYNVSSFTINWLSLVFPVTAVPFSLVSAWFIDTYGLRCGILLAAWLNGIGSVTRLLSSIRHMTSTERFAVVMLGQSLSALAQTLILPMPPKLAALWFNDSQRVLANMISSTGSMIGILLASVLGPYIVYVQKDIPILLTLFAIPGVLAMILATAGVTTARPPTPPASSAAEDSESFLEGLKQATKSKQFWVLVVCLGTGIGLFSSATTLLEQIICIHNYSDAVAGNLTALTIGVGIIGAALVSIYVDKTKQFEVVAKLCYAMATLFVIFFVLISKYENETILLGFSISGFGFFGLALLPIGLELAVECTYPVAEATSASIVWLFSQIVMILLILVTGELATTIPKDKRNGTCKSDTLDMTKGAYFMAAVAVAIALSFIVFFRPKCLRMEAERRERLSQSCQSSDTNYDHD